ncbi:hypothetical protein WME90_33005 [Sorangium sp. So ce375]|uniref:hypothetical protein n=1 Tax=Sorangium sp. So ce375 TaxID=3133306 RepID=UPI003F5C48EE
MGEVCDRCGAAPVAARRGHDEQPADCLVDDTSRNVISEGDGAAEGAGERGNHGGARRRIGLREVSDPEARRLGPGWVHAF